MNDHERKMKNEKRRGFSLLECLLLTMVVGIVAASTGRLLQSVARVPRESDLQFQLDTALVSKMEALRGLPYTSLPLGDPSSALCDTLTLNGKSYTRSVSVANVDINGDGTVDANIKRIVVRIGGMSLSTLVNQP